MNSNQKNDKKSKIRWEDLDHKKVYGAIAVLVAAVALIIVLIVKGVSGGKTETPENSSPETEAVQPEEEGNPLEVNANEEINELITNYYTGRASGDFDLLASAVDVLTDEEKQEIERERKYIEAYNNINCYTKKGLEEGTYVVFASYEMKISDIETEAPGIQAFYVCTGEDGSLYIFNGEAPEDMTNYVLELAAEEDVASIIEDVQIRYQELTAADEDLGRFAETLRQLQEEAAAEPSEEQEPEAPAENDESGEEAQSEPAGEPFSTTVTSNVRIREERSTDSAIVEVLASGTGVTVHAVYEDGWSKVEYNGSTGYCKTEFLENTQGEQTGETETQEETASSDGAAEAVNKQMQFKDTVRIRADRSTDSERVATGYTKELVTVLETYSDGWSKIEYNGTTGYCKTEFLQEPQ